MKGLILYITSIILVGILYPIAMLYGAFKSFYQRQIGLDEAIKLVKEVKPIKFNWKNDESKSVKTGYSAQQTAKSGYDHLITLLPKEGLEERIDDDGFISPKDTQFLMNYDQVIPYHGTVIKYLL